MEREREKRGREKAIELGKRLFLLPEEVMNTVRYWMANYTDFNTDSERFFQSLIRGLLEKPVTLEISASESLATRQSTTVKYQAILKFIGTPYHRIPMAYCATNYNFQLFSLMGALTEPDMACFKQRVAPGLDGELHLSSFHYDLLLNEYYDPMLFILTAYFINMSSLINPLLTQCREKEDWLRPHFNSLRAIDEESLERIACFPRDVNGERTDALKKELRILHKNLETDNIEKAMENCRSLYDIKATECFSRFSSPTEKSQEPGEI